MAADAHIQGWRGPSRRRVPRFRMDTPLDVTVLRSGIPDTVPGRAVNVCERGIAAVLAGELAAGESVGVEVRLSSATEPLRTRATVRYQEKLRYGFEFMTISPEQRTAIRDWAREARAETEMTVSSVPTVDRDEKKDLRISAGPRLSGGGEPPRKVIKKRRGVRWLIALLVLAA